MSEARLIMTEMTVLSIREPVTSDVATKIRLVGLEDGSPCIEVSQGSGSALISAEEWPDIAEAVRTLLAVCDQLKVDGG